MITKLEIWGSPDIQITEAGDPIQFKTETDHVRVRIRDGKVLIEVLGRDASGECWNRYKINETYGELELKESASILGGNKLG